MSQKKKKKRKKKTIGTDSLEISVVSRHPFYFFHIHSSICLFNKHLPFFLSLYNWQITLCEYKAHSRMIWYTCILWNNYHNNGSFPGSGRIPGVGNGNTVHYSCLENSMDSKAWVGYSQWCWKESNMIKWMSTARLINTFITSGNYHFVATCWVHLRPTLSENLKNVI